MNRAGLLTAVSRTWHSVRNFIAVLAIIRFSLFLGLLGSVMMFLDQGQEILIALALMEEGKHAAWAVTLASSVLCGLSVWYCARTMYRFRFAGNAMSDSAQFPRLKRWLPRLMGAGVMMLSGVASLRAAHTVKGADDAQLLGMSQLASGLLLLLVLSKRRDWFGDLGGLERYARESRDLRSWRQLGATTRWVFLLLFLAAIGMSSAVAFRHDIVGAVLGGTGVVMVAAALIVPVGSTIVYWANHHDVPAMLGLLGIVVVCSFLADNHHVRRSADAQGSHPFEIVDPPPAQNPIAHRGSIDAYLDRWLALREPSSGSLPVFIVAAEGGGIRAAYWTALVLGTLQDRAQREGFVFSRHLLGISGVSGGSFGAAVFAAMTARPESAGGNCHGHTTTTEFARRAQRVLNHDFLAPSLAVFLFTDLQQRFLPMTFFDDRGVALERSWERAWRACETGNLFAAPFSSLWRDPEGAMRFDVPLLFLNSTVVETGQRLILNPFALPSHHFAARFADAVDGTRVLGDEVPLSTAVHASARFTYVSPAGTVQHLPEPNTTGQPPRWFRVVDGGYFENSGAATAEELLEALEARATATGFPVRPFIIHISNQPHPSPRAPDGRLRLPSPHQNRRVLLPGVLSPIWAMLNARPARGRQARAVLEHRAGDDHVHFELRDHGVVLPLGWMLSPRSQDNMVKQLTGYPQDQSPTGCAATSSCDNRQNIERVLEILRASAP